MNKNKASKKSKRFCARLKSTKGIVSCEFPSLNVILHNIGQGTGLNKDKMQELLAKHLPNLTFQKFIAEKGETHSFIIFNDIPSSLLFVNTFNGKVKLEDKGPPIYTSFVEKVPETETICDDHELPKGLHIIKEFITESEEYNLITQFDWSEEGNNLKNRQVRHFGYEFRYGSNDVDLDKPLCNKIPEACNLFWKKMNEAGFNLNKKPDQLTVNKYLPGQGIPNHVDRHSPFGDMILSVSLGGNVVMDWKHHTGKHVPLEVPARSILIMTGEARYDWQHGIQPRALDPVILNKTIVMNGNEEKRVKVITHDTVERKMRISLTFRWTRVGPCQCHFRTLCDTTVNNADNLNDDVAAHLEELHVHQVYEQIADHFSTTRHKPWPKVVEFMENVAAGAIVLDLGCGNGKNILRRNDIVQIGGERSSGLLSECRNHINNISAADCVKLDLLNAMLRDACADIVICIAVIHHLSSKSRRQQAITTISRLLRSNGRALITVWAKDQSKSNYLSRTKQENLNSESNELITVGDVNLPVHKNRTQFQHNDLLVPWKLRRVNEKKLADQPESTLLRYYHVFEDGELEQLCSETLGLSVESSFYEEGNWCVICKKP